jgi:hypothetical protein
MAWQLDRDLLRYDDGCASGYMAAMVFSNTDEDNGVLKTPEATASNDFVCPRSCGLDGPHDKMAERLLC